ncbi:hypothetical protein ACFO3A_14335 [Comamonas nitrativorans]|uniref:RNA polymerase sigma factor 70 region 4 type 2 domain-containing protein n=1 Tax=Comamonas nitrativorans TaxID=108437 RepID=A0ABV9H1V0_9BURK
MLFRTPRPTDAFQRALRAAVTGHRPAALCALRASHGDRMFALALSDLSGRVMADALSMLPVSSREGVRRHLTRTARRRLRQFDNAGTGVAPRQSWLTVTHRCIGILVRPTASATRQGVNP